MSGICRVQRPVRTSLDAVRPNFFIVGAAKAGTTAMHRYLDRHPDVYMSAVKEPSYFAPEMRLSTPWATDLDRYLELFSPGAERRIRGESTPAYLYCPASAQRLRDFAPDARILIVLRNPLDAVQSVHTEARKFGVEPERTFPAALRASDAGRPELEARPGGLWLRYRDVVRYAEQVERYLTAFPPEQVHIAFYDDLVREPASVYAAVLDFLGLDPLELATFPAVNPARRVRSLRLQRLIMAPSTVGTARPAGPLRRTLVRLNTGPTNKQALPDDIRRSLVDDLAPDIERLGRLVDRDLSPWLESDGPTQA